MLWLCRAQVAGGNGEQCLSRDIYRLGTQFDFMRLMAWCELTLGHVTALRVLLCQTPA